MANQKRGEPTRDIVTLADLAPSRDVRGGRGRQVFGATAVDAVRNVHQEDNMAASKKTKDLSPKSNPKGGAKKLAANASLTLVRAAKPAIKKDMSPKSNPKGGKKVR